MCSGDRVIISMKYNIDERKEEENGTGKDKKLRVNLVKNDFENINFKSEKFFEKSIWNIGNVSAYTGYAVGTLYNLVCQNLIPYRKKRGRLFFIPHEIQNWIEEGN